MTKTYLAIPALAAFALALPVATPANAVQQKGETMQFCDSGSSDCKDIYAKNGSAALVTSVNVTETGTGCSGEKKVHEANLVGSLGDYFKIKARKTCNYVITYKTTSGCTGEKSVKIIPNKMTEGKDVAKLGGSCGTLNTKVISRLAIGTGDQ
jgi:hypothetical protein